MVDTAAAEVAAGVVEVLEAGEEAALVVSAEVACRVAVAPAAVGEEKVYA